ncbi:MAG: bifunctional diaminohydroxyphosphoribosylaminopyrimidine deaminase/5-amino-6-(5-phosphoribosylamino)uracil reductase RibD [candidate division Zixibacteria bacterium]|nr:bifunctional diaminohydroxyphosphoribosylaminopyrimidine deaminase/5-amino-6-(5-phosphoribosylamino)uracil reductase RibD [candidate division Zixibacteria bacterium]
MSKFSERDIQYMRRAFELARKGWGKVSPNPMVGAVLVKNGEVIAEGYHAKFGGPHAESNAIRNAKGQAEGSTLYVNLEPCNHHGKTPPCAGAVIEAGIREVVCSNRDVNPKVKGHGFRKLRNAGLRVRSGLLREEGYRLNEVYFKNITERAPFVVLKAAMSLDGYIYSDHLKNRYLSGKEFLKYVHRLRAGYDAVLIGARTAIVDNPRLDVRHVRGRNPVRVILSDGARLPEELNVINGNSSQKTVIAVPSVNSNQVPYGENIELWKIRSRRKRFPIREFLEQAMSKGINSILVEGGREIFQAFLSEHAVDKMIISHTPFIFGSGVHFIDTAKSKIKLDSIKFKFHKWETIGYDSVFTGYPDFYTDN